MFLYVFIRCHIKWIEYKSIRRSNMSRLVLIFSCHTSARSWVSRTYWQATVASWLTPWCDYRVWQSWRSCSECGLNFVVCPVVMINRLIYCSILETQVLHCLCLWRRRRASHTPYFFLLTLLLSQTVNIHSSYVLNVAFTGKLFFNLFLTFTDQSLFNV